MLDAVDADEERRSITCWENSQSRENQNLRAIKKTKQKTIIHVGCTKDSEHDEKNQR